MSILPAFNPSVAPRFTSTRNTPIRPSPKTEWQRAVWNSDLPCGVKGFLQNLAVGWMDADGGSCYPSEDQIMERLGCSRPTLTRWIRIAEQAGFLEVTRYGRGLRNRRYNYQATLPGVPAPAVEMGKNFSDPSPEMGKNFSDHDQPCPNYNHEERAPEPASPEPASPEPAASSVPPVGALSEPATQPKPPKAPIIPIPSKTSLPDDWQLPDDYRAWAEQQRPDLADRLDAIATNFFDYHASKGTKSASWLAEWRRWINRERAVKPPQNARAATQPPNRYPSPKPRTQEQEDYDRRQEAYFEAKRVERLIRMGYDPVTGLKFGTLDSEPEPREPIPESIPVAVPKPQPPPSRRWTQAEQVKIMAIAGRVGSIREAIAVFEAEEGKRIIGEPRR